MNISICPLIQKYDLKIMPLNSKKSAFSLMISGKSQGILKKGGEK
jgi:hypothetical protein